MELVNTKYNIVLNNEYYDIYPLRFYTNSYVQNVNVLEETSNEINDYISIHNINSEGNYLVILGNNPIPSNEGQVFLKVINTDNIDLGLYYVPSGEFQLKIPLYSLRGFQSNFLYISVFKLKDSIIDVKKYDQIYMELSNNVRSIIKTNNLTGQQFYKTISIPIFHFIRIEPRILGIIKTMHRKMRFFTRTRYVNAIKWYLLSVKYSGVPCPYCNVNYSELYRRILEDGELELYNISNVNNFCIHCASTGYLGGFDFVSEVDVLIQTVEVNELDADKVVTGTGYMNAVFPLKIGDYLTNGMDIFIVINFVETRKFYNYPIWYRFNVSRLPYTNPLYMYVNNIINNMNKFSLPVVLV